MRGLGVLLLAAALTGGCATASRPSTARADASAPPRRCSTADPDRWAWFCVVGQILYGAASFFQPVNEVSMR